MKNEEAILRKTLSKITKVFDEVVIVDTGSTDGTLEIIEEFIQECSYCNIILKQFEWCMDYSAARNFSYSFATKDYVTWWDADDILTEEMSKFLTDIRLGRETLSEVYRIPTVTERSESGAPLKSIMNPRIVLRLLNPKWDYKIHEQLFFDKPNTSITLKGITVEHQKDLHNPHHLQFYLELSNLGHYFVFHDYYFMMNEMVLNNYKEAAGISWYKTNFREAMRVQRDWPGYVGMTYRRLMESEDPDFIAQFDDLREEMLSFLLKVYAPDARVCCWLAEYYNSHKGQFSTEQVRYWAIQADNSRGNDYEFIDSEYWSDRAKKLLYLL